MNKEQSIKRADYLIQELLNSCEYISLSKDIVERAKELIVFLLENDADNFVLDQGISIMFDEISICYRVLKTVNLACISVTRSKEGIIFEIDRTDLGKLIKTHTKDSEDIKSVIKYVHENQY